MKLSQFTHLFKRQGLNLLYSSRNNSFLQLSDGLYAFLETLRNNNGITGVPPEFASDIAYLIDQSVVIETADVDIDYINTLKINHQQRKFATDHIGLTILPTLSCNLRCPYCFEHNKKSGLMTGDTEDNLIKFVSDHKNARTYSITWFGGEPLLGLDVIESLLGKFEKLSDIRRLSHTIVSNGTLFDERAYELFKKYPLDSIQITFDGIGMSHDKKRKFPDGRGSYDLILSKLGEIEKELPDTFVSVRFNVDNFNKDEYYTFRDEFRQRFGQRFSCYPALLRPNSECRTEQFFSIDDSVEFHKKLNNSGNKADFLPKIESKGCTATNLSSYVVGPEGELYLCWEHVGESEFIIGHIDNPEFTNPRLFNRFILDGDCFNDDDCLKCIFLPICSGGCPQKRLESPNSRKSQCTILKHNNSQVLEDFLFCYYQSTLK